MFQNRPQLFILSCFLFASHGLIQASGTNKKTQKKKKTSLQYIEHRKFSPGTIQNTADEEIIYRRHQHQIDQQTTPERSRPPARIVAISCLSTARRPSEGEPVIRPVSIISNLIATSSLNLYWLNNIFIGDHTAWFSTETLRGRWSQCPDVLTVCRTMINRVGFVNHSPFGYVFLT